MAISRRSQASACKAPKSHPNSGFKKVDLKRAIDGAKRMGMDIGAVDIRPDGTITIRTATASTSKATGVFEQWEGHL